MKVYKKSLDETRVTLAKLYEKYSVDGVLNYSDMIKYNRLATMQTSISKQMQDLYKETGRLFSSYLGDMYTLNYYYTGYIIEIATQEKLAFNLISADVINQAIQNPISGLTLNDRLQKNRNDIIIKTREQLTQGLIQGESIQKMAKRIKNIYEGDLNKSLTISQTETTRVRNEGKELGYQKAEAKGIEFTRVWVSTLDSRTRRNHQKLDGMKANKDGYFVVGRFEAKHPGGFGVAEMDINCRCTTRAEFQGLEPTQRRARGEGIIDYKTYDAWKKDRVSK